MFFKGKVNFFKFCFKVAYFAGTFDQAKILKLERACDDSDFDNPIELDSELKWQKRNQLLIYYDIKFGTYEL